MHSMCLWGFLAISCLTVTTVLCQDVTENCHERMEECKKVAFEEEDEEKRNNEIAACFGSFKCSSGEDSIRDDMKKGALTRAQGWRRKRWGSTGIASSIKVNFKFVAACLVTVLGLAHF